MQTKECNTCHEHKPLTEFDTNGWNQGDRNGKRKYHAHCKLCAKITLQEIFISRLEEAVGGELKCSECGYNKHSSAIDFHHLDPNQKENQVSDLRGSSYERIKKEVDKCIMLCANCHRILHWNKTN